MESTTPWTAFVINPFGTVQIFIAGRAFCAHRSHWETGQQKQHTKRIILELSAKVIESLAKDYAQVQKGVWNIMVGKVIETEAKTILNQGITQGKLDTYLELLRDGLISVTDAAKRLCLSEDAVKEMMK